MHNRFLADDVAESSVSQSAALRLREMDEVDGCDGCVAMSAGNDPPAAHALST
jgi:hypothetical protein